MLTPVVPSHNLVVIAVESRRCAVARFFEVAPFVFELDRAVNWEEIEYAARAAVVEMVGAIVGNDHYPCPAALAEQAVWED